MIDTVQDAPADAAIRGRALDALRSGQIVALPTETVYGLAVRADRPELLERLATLKGRDHEQHFTQAIARRESLATVEELQPLVRRLAERYWPGPLTLVTKTELELSETLAPDGWLGLRVPAQGAVLDLIEAADFPVALTSANRHGSPPATEAAAIAAEFGDDVPVVWDGGPARLGEASGVLRVGRGSFELLREGLIDLPALRKTAGRRLVFVCTGNTCRSPMAEALARALLTERLGGDPADFGFEIASMGVFGAPGSPASQDAVDVLEERGVDLSGHRSSPLIDELLVEADEILCLTRSHAQALLASIPPRLADHVTLLDPDGHDVPDPIGQGIEVYRRTADAIESALRARLDGWA